MIFLLLSIFSSSFLMVVFKITAKRKLDAYNVIVINYITAAIIGFTIAGQPTIDILASDWLPSAIIIGILFIVVFLLMAFSTKESGIALTTVAVKMSVIIPICFSIIYYYEDLSILKITGISLAMIAVFLTVYKKREHRSKTRMAYILPLLLFVGSGTIDTLIKYTQASFLEEDSTILFTSVLFLIAGLSGIIYSPLRKKHIKGYFKRDIVLYGMILGLINFGSLYGIVMALEKNIFDSSIIFGINNIGIVVLSVSLALVIFREQLSTRNKFGIALSIFTIIILSFVK